MKINNIGLSNINPYKKQMDKIQQVGQVSKKADKVEISEEAKGLQQVSHIELERNQKVETLKQQVQSGNYKIDKHEIAKKVYEYWSNN